MGQQQLLLVILVTIIVGIATVVAINTFGTAADNANLDAVRQDLASIAASAQGFYMKPTMMDGGGRSFEGVTFDKVAFAASSITNGGLTAVNDNGTYIITAPGTGAQTMVVTGYPASATGYSEGSAGSVADADDLEITIEKDGLTWNT